MSQVQSASLSPGFFDPLNDTSLEVTIPKKKNVDENVVVKFVSAFFASSKAGCACTNKKKIEKIYSY